MATRYHWIVYLSQNFPGNILFDLERATSIAQVRELYADYCRAVGTDECTATVYPYSDAEWASAVEYRDSGCPFDYPSLIIERGPRGGIRVERA